MATLEHTLEALLFYVGESLSRARIATLLGVPEEEVIGLASQLSATLHDRGVRLLAVGDQYELVTAPETSDMITKVRKEELLRDLGKAGAETLSIILYRGPVTRAGIEYVRGVNCSFVLRNLLIRGLVERIPNPANIRSVQYAVTPDFLKHLGITSVQDLPEYATVQKEIDAFEQAEQEDPEHTTPPPSLV
ncbi:MAG: SMC-Scp complex subunit ScpB [Candidatus Pacebacteria bacterium]|nr:SMC-Scp complex subunit ScpB [Candidatus Paceibacterota bacterium]